MQQHRHSDRVDFATMFGGMVLVTEEEIARRERTAETQRKRDRLAACGIGETLADEDRERILSGRLRRTEPITLVERWSAGAPAPGCPTAKLEEHTRGWLVLCGGRGTGKSVAASWWISRVGGVYVTFAQLIRLYASRDTGLDASRARAEDRLDTIARATYLVVDELGTERLTGKLSTEAWRGLVSETWLWLVDSRKTRRKRTLVLSNLSSRDFVARHRSDGGMYDPRAYDRLRACADVHEVSGGSLRGRAET